MARMIKTESTLNLELKVSTIFEEDDTVIDHLFKVGDIVEDLRYVEDEAIKVVSGKIKEINYTTANKISWNKNKPADTLAKDITLTNVVIDCSQQYESNVVTVPVMEIVEWADENQLGVVKRMKVEPSINMDLKLSFSDNTVQALNIAVGDTFDHVKIINPNDIGNDITGKFEVIAFAYKFVNKKPVVTGLALKNVNTGVVGVYDLGFVIGLNEVYTVAGDTVESILDALRGGEGVKKLEDGDTLSISGDIDNSTESGQFLISGVKDVTVKLDGSVTTANSATSNFLVQNASVTFTGNGVVKASKPYDRNHATGVITLSTGADVVFDGPGIDADLGNADAGQFGIVGLRDAKITFKSGNFKSGWYPISSNGLSENHPEIIIHGGRFISTQDYAGYFPSSGSVVIDGDAYFEGLVGGIAQNAGSLTISGNVTVKTAGAHSAIEATYTDGTSTMETESAALNLNAKYGDIVCRISGGKFIGGSGVTIATGSTHNVDLKISGGAFSQPITNPDWLEEGYVCEETARDDGLFYVVKADTPVG